MYGLLITFNTEIQLEDLEAPFTDYANALCNVAGLISKAWINDGSTVGGFHLFESKVAADAYTSSDLARGLIDTEGFDNFEVRGFEVLGALNAITGIDQSAQALANA